MHINWVWDTDRAPDPTHIGDFFILAIVVLAVLFFLIAQLLVILRYNTTSVRARRGWSLELMIIGSITHILAEFVTNAHIGHNTWFDIIRTFHCTFWDYWMKYGLGFNLWQVGQAGRLFAWFVTLELKANSMLVTDENGVYMINSHENGLAPLLKDSSANAATKDANVATTTQLVNTIEAKSGGSNGGEYDAVESFSIGSGNPVSSVVCGCNILKRLWRPIHQALYKRRFGLLILATCVGLATPGFVLCGAVELTHGTRYSEIYNWCVTNSEFVYATVAWLFVCVAILLVLLLRMRKYDGRESTSYCATRDSTYIGIICLIVLVILNRFEVSVTWWGRCLQTLLVVAMNVFSYARLCWGMFKDAYFYGICKENPQTQETTLSDLEDVLAGDDREPTFAGILRTKRSLIAFRTWVQKLPIWTVPSLFSSGMETSQLTKHLAIQCVAKKKPDGQFCMQPSGSRRLRIRNDSNVGTTAHFAIEDDGDDDDQLLQDSHGRNNPHSSEYQFVEDSNESSSSSSLMADSIDEFSQVPLDLNRVSNTTLNQIQQSLAHTIDICPADVWDLYDAYNKYRVKVEYSELHEAISDLRDILLRHFPLAEPPATLAFYNDEVKNENPIEEDKEENKTDLPNESQSSSTPLQPVNTQEDYQPLMLPTNFNNAGSIAASVVGMVFPLTFAAQMAPLNSANRLQATLDNRPKPTTGSLLLDRQQHPVARVFAQFFAVNRPESCKLTEDKYSRENSLEPIIRGGIHTLPMTNSDLRVAYIAAAQCSNELDMNDPLASIKWMCEFLLGEVWLPYCLVHDLTLTKLYKAERRLMAQTVAINEGLASRAPRLQVTVV
jgi:hypothetical protein